MLDVLKKAGLSDKEARIYLSALELGKATADQIAKHAKVNRSTTYVQIESLMKGGLMSTFDEGKKTFFSPESPEHLTRLIAEQQQVLAARSQALTAVLPSLNSLFTHAGERPVVRFFDGKEGLRAIREEVLRSEAREIFVISSHEAFAEIFSEAERETYAKRRIEKGIELHLIYTAKRPIAVPPPLMTHRTYMGTDQLTIATDILLFREKIGFLNLQGRISGVLIESKALYESMRSIFSLLRSQGKIE